MKNAKLTNTLAGLGLLLLLSATGALAQGWQVSPARQEIMILPGETKTFAVRVERDPSNAKEPVRFTATPRDWDLSRAGEVLEGAVNSLPDSAGGWMTFTPAVFNLEQGAFAWVRVSFSVPKETAPGVYRAALFFEEHSAVPQPAEGMRRMVLRYRLSSLIYVVVPKVQKMLEVKDVTVTGSADAGLTLRAVFDNQGTMYVRPQHWAEISDADGKLLLKLEAKPTMPVLPRHQLEVSLEIPKGSLPAASTYNIRYFVDADKELPIKATSVSLVAQAPK
jgi:hypothetical protein